MVFTGTLVFALIIGALHDDGRVRGHGPGRCGSAGLVSSLSTALLGLVHGINHGWDRLVHHVVPVDFRVDFGTDSGDGQGQTSPSTGTYPRVVLRDS